MTCAGREDDRDNQQHTIFDANRAPVMLWKNEGKDDVDPGATYSMVAKMKHEFLW